MKAEDKQPGICTHCGEPGKLTDDHIFPRALWVGPSNERPPMVKSCETCNHHSNEALLAFFVSMVDERLTHKRARVLATKQGRGELLNALSLSYGGAARPGCDHLPMIRDWPNNLMYPDEKIAKLFKKMFQGLRRHLLAKFEPEIEWDFVSPARLRLFSVRMDGGNDNLFEWPLQVGANPHVAWPGKYLPSEFTCEDRFRDFHFGMDGDWLELRHEQTWQGNELHILCWIQPE